MLHGSGQVRQASGQIALSDGQAEIKGRAANTELESIAEKEKDEIKTQLKTKMIYREIKGYKKTCSQKRSSDRDKEVESLIREKQSG